MRVGKHKQHPPSAQLFQREIATAIQPWELEPGRRGPGAQAIALDPAARQRAIAETVGPVSFSIRGGRRGVVLIHRLAIPAARLLVRFPEFQFINSLLQLFESQKHPPVLTQELPAKPAACGKDEPHQPKPPLEHAAHGWAKRHIRVAAGCFRNRKRNH